MVVTTMFAHNQHRAVLRTQVDVIRQDVAMRATGVAVDILEEVGSMSFDEATKGGTVTDPSLLTSLPLVDVSLATDPLDPAFELLLGEDEGEAGGADDLDDFNARHLDRNRRAGEHQLNFTAMPVVNYIGSDGVTPVDYVTKMKRVRIEVASSDFAFADTIQISQVFTCGSRCAW